MLCFLGPSLLWPLESYLIYHQLELLLGKERPFCDGVSYDGAFTEHQPKFQSNPCSLNLSPKLHLALEKWQLNQ